MKPINAFMATGEISKQALFPQPSTDLRGGGGPYIWFGYVPHNINNNLQGKVSGSMNAGTINMIHTSKQITK